LLVGTAGTNTTGLTITTTTNKSLNIYGGRAVFFNGTADTGYDWLTTVSAGSPYVFSGLVPGSYTTMLVGATTDTSNHISGSLTLTGLHTHNSLKLTSGATLAIGANTLTLTSGGLLSVGSAASAITGTAGASRLIGGNGSGGAFDLIIHQFNSAGLNISAVIGNNGANPTTLTKAGSGPLTLSGINTYTGATTVNSGRLIIDSAGSIASTSSVTVRGGEFSYNSPTALTKAVTFADPSATLSGTGTLGTEANTIQGVHAPGNPAANNGVGTQAFTANLTYGASSRLQWQLTDNVTATRGVQFDAVNVTGGAFAIIPGATLDLVFSGSVNFTNSFWDTNRTWTVVDVISPATAPDGNVFNLGTITGGSYSANEGFFTITRSSGDVILNWTATVVVITAYEQWAIAKGLTGAPGSATDPAASADPDKDGTNNLAEFAFNGNPTNGASTGQIHGLTADSSDGGTNKEMILTVAVRKTAPAFTTAAPSTSTVDGITYRIEGGTNLSLWATTVTRLDTPLTFGLPAITDTVNYEYRSFSLSGSDGLPGKGFLRARVTQP
jgi:autotransporter-associated beta strand protein